MFTFPCRISSLWSPLQFSVVLGTIEFQSTADALAECVFPKIVCIRCTFIWNILYKPWFLSFWLHFLVSEVLVANGDVTKTIVFLTHCCTYFFISIVHGVMFALWTSTVATGCTGLGFCDEKDRISCTVSLYLSSRFKLLSLFLVPLEPQRKKPLLSHWTNPGRFLHRDNVCSTVIKGIRNAEQKGILLC